MKEIVKARLNGKKGDTFEVIDMAEYRSISLAYSDYIWSSSCPKILDGTKFDHLIRGESIGHVYAIEGFNLVFIKEMVYNATVKLTLEVDPDMKDVEDALNDMDYDFASTSEGLKIKATEIIRFSKRIAKR